MSWAALLAPLITALLRVANTYLERRDMLEMKDAGAAEHMADAAAELMATLAKKEAVDAAILGGDADDWLERVRADTAARRRSRLLPDHHDGDRGEPGGQGDR